MVEDGSEYLTRREAEIIIENGARQAEQHSKQHIQEMSARELALQVEARERATYVDSHNREHVSHESIHALEQEAVKVALSAVDRERIIHAEAHSGEHDSHEIEHDLNNLAIDKAERGNDRRFDDLRLENNRRYAELRGRVEVIEKLDVKGEGRQLGQAAVIGLIIGSVGFFSTLLGIIIVAVNILTGNR